MQKVDCTRCGRAHPPAIEGGVNQGQGCATEVEKGFLVGAYGSAVADMSVLAFTHSPLPDGAVVCDICLRQGLETGWLVFKSEA